VKVVPTCDVQFIFVGVPGGVSKNLPSRIAYISIMVTALAIIASYSGLITSVLMFEKPNFPFKSFKEFVKDGSYRITSKAPGYLNYELRVCIFIFCGSVVIALLTRYTSFLGHKRRRDL